MRHQGMANGSLVGHFAKAASAREIEKPYISQG
jgi:hypothetical protein